VLIYPYYTVNHQQTLLSVINTTAHGKALKVRFREGYDGRDIANFNVYLGLMIHGSARCSIRAATAPVLRPSRPMTTRARCRRFPLAPVPGTLHALTFSNANYSQGDYGTPTGTDHGPTSLARTREGFLEIIEMGEVVDQASGSPKTLEAITPVNGTPPGCAQVRNAWAPIDLSSPGGYWTTNATTDLLPPAGGLYGAAGIVDVSLGTLYAYDATAIDGFSDVVQNSAPGDPKPNLSTAITDTAHDIASAYVSDRQYDDQGRLRRIRTRHRRRQRRADSGSHLQRVRHRAGPGRRDGLVVTFPTKQFYVDPAIIGANALSAVRPFETPFDELSCLGADRKQVDRDGFEPSLIGGVPPITGGNYICHEAAVITFGTDFDASKALGSRIADLQDLSYLSLPVGNLALKFVDPQEQMRPAASGAAFNGVPAIGFAATNYINANVTPGVLSNYSAAYPHRTHASCTNSTNPQSACP
jgi:hypothetical protein